MEVQGTRHVPAGRKLQVDGDELAVRLGGRGAEGDPLPAGGVFERRSGNGHLSFLLACCASSVLVAQRTLYGEDAVIHDPSSKIDGRAAGEGAYCPPWRHSIPGHRPTPSARRSTP